MKLTHSISRIACSTFLMAAVCCGASAYASPALNSSTTNAQDAAASDLSGSWQLTFTDPTGTTRPATLQIKQSGTQLSGTFQGKRGSAGLTGSNSDNHVTIAIASHGRSITLTGTLEGNKMSGTSADGGPWSATRQ